MIAENAMLSVSIPLLTEPLLHLLGLYASQGTKNSGVPTATAILRFLNFVALLLYVVAAAYMGIYLRDWNDVLSSDGLVDPDNLPSPTPVDFVRIAPIVASFFILIIILGGLLLWVLGSLSFRLRPQAKWTAIELWRTTFPLCFSFYLSRLPVARGESKNSKPGGFLALLFILLAIPVIYRILQTLHASTELQGDDTSDNPFAPVFNLGSPPMRVGNNMVLAGIASNSDDPNNTIPPGMYNPMEEGIAWDQLQQTLAGRGRPQTPLIFNLVYILPQWWVSNAFDWDEDVESKENSSQSQGRSDEITDSTCLPISWPLTSLFFSSVFRSFRIDRLMVFLFFFVHAPGNHHHGGSDDNDKDKAWSCCFLRSVHVSSLLLLRDLSFLLPISPCKS